MEINNQNQPIDSTKIPVQSPPIFNLVNNQRGFFPIILGVLVLLIVVGGGAYYLGVQKSSVSLNPSPSPIVSTNQQSFIEADKTIAARKEKIRQVSREDQQNECYASLYETTRAICKVEAGYDPGPTDGSGVKEWLSLSEKEKTNEMLFWDCYERVSANEALKCETKYPDVTKQRNAYYDCLSKGVDIPKYCGDDTGYIQQNNFPKDKETQYWQCVENTRIEKEGKCTSETGYNPN